MTKLEKAQAKRTFIQKLLELNPEMKQVGNSDVWMGAPALDAVEGQSGFKMINMIIALPNANSTLEGSYIISADGIKIRLWRE